MVVCQYFLQGWCKFGSNCRNEHVYQHAARNNPREVEKFYDGLIVELVAAERGKQWPLSCFAPLKNHPPIPKLEDTSPDELRYNYYTAKSKGPTAIDQYCALVKQLIQNADDMKAFLKRPSPELTAMLNGILEKKSSEPSNAVPPSTNVASNFRFDVGAVSGGHPSVFGDANSSYSTQHNPPVSNIFGGTPAVVPKPTVVTNTFSQAPTNLFSLNPSVPFGQTNTPMSGPVHNASIFSNQNNVFDGRLTTPHTAPQNIFSNSSPLMNQNIFGGNVAPNVSMPSTQMNFNAPAQNIVRVPPESSQNVSSNQNCYSKMEDLSDDDKMCFEAPVFRLGRIPLKPPAQSYC